MNGLLLRLAARRVRTRTLVWSAGAAVLVAGSIAGYVRAYPDPALRADLSAALAGQPALVTLMGVPGDLTTTGGFVAFRLGVLLPVLVGLFALLTTAALTRSEEEAGVREAVWAGAVRRTGPLLAAVTVTATACTLIGAAIVAALYAGGAGGTSAWLFGAACTAVGLVHVGVAALAAQLATTRRATSGLAGAVLGAGYLARAAADTVDGAGWLGWVSPLGWAQRVGPYSTNDPAPIALAAAVTAVLIAVAVAVEARRDLGAGLLPARPGPARSRSLRTPEALAARLHAAATLAWMVGVGIAAALFGAIIDSVAGLAAGNPRLVEMAARAGGAPGQFVDVYADTLYQLIGMLVAVVAVQGVLVARHDEAAGRAEPLLALPLRRARWLGSHLLAGLGSATAVAAVAGLAGAAAWAAAAEHARPAALLAAAANALPVAVLCAGLATAAVALVPRLAAPLALAVPVVGYVANLTGRLLDLPDAVLAISPFHHVAVVPAEPVDLASTAALLAVGVVLAAVGLAAVPRRDLASA